MTLVKIVAYINIQPNVESISYGLIHFAPQTPGGLVITPAACLFAHHLADGKGPGHCDNSPTFTEGQGFSGKPLAEWCGW